MTSIGNQFQYKPTVRPKTPFGQAEQEEDAKALQKAMKGLGTDEKVIINILANRTNNQRQLIAHRFESLFGKKLIDELKKELGGSFEDVVVGCMLPLDRYFAQELHDAMHGPGTREDALIEILCVLDNAWLKLIQKTYYDMFDKDLEYDIKRDTAACFEKLLLALLEAKRDESVTVDSGKVDADVDALYAAGEKKIGTDEEIFIDILTKRSFAHLQVLFREYKNKHGSDFHEVIEKEFEGETEDALVTMVRCYTNTTKYFARQLHKAMDGVGTNNRALIRTIVTRSEFDLGNIKEAYVKEYEKSLIKAIEDDCSGDFKRMLVALID
ncbi:annexin B9-like [Neocloeon triangulifer]|uniref:annexin B9-like n=1 Tax=Neocloeon triangulifer TaxID=2078957 RepID=UPI00286F2EEF|nr:annexin B9-like [Neocloeon triangulifer]